jgi:hypothetical protein
VGMVGISGAVPTVGNTLIVGTAAAELTPRLLISVDPNAIPVRATPPGVVGDVDVGVDDEAILLEPEPHIPDNPDVSIIPEVVDIPDVAEIPDDVDVDVPDIAVAPDVAAVAGVAAPTAVPPPSKLAVEPNIPDGEVPEVEHVVPLPGIAIVPVEVVGIGLTPGEAISVAPIGIPVGETDEPDVTPSGEVAPMVGVGVAVPPTCAMATLQTNSAGRTAAINEYLIGALRLQTASLRRAPMSISFTAISLGAKLSDIGQSLVIALRCQWWRVKLRKNPQRQIFSFLFNAASNFCCFESNVGSLAAPLFRTSLTVGRWLARAGCSIKYEFMFLAPIPSRLHACDIRCSDDARTHFGFRKLKIVLLEQVALAPASMDHP